MSIFYIRYFWVVFLVCFFKIGIAQDQKIIDSLAELDFDYFREYFDKQSIDSLHDILHAKAYLKKAMDIKDTFKIANAYYFLSDASRDLDALKYCDSIIYITKNFKKNDTYPALGYMQKGVIYHRIGNYDNALYAYNDSYDASLESNNKLYVLTARENMGLLSDKMGKRKEALDIFRSYVAYLENDNEIEYRDYYLETGLYYLAKSYIHNQKPDSANHFIDKGLTKAMIKGDSVMHAKFVCLSGINLYYSKDYETAIDSLLRCKQICYNQILNATANLYLGKVYHLLSHKEKAMQHFREVDSFLQKTHNISVEFIEIYPSLISYEEEKDDLQQQLGYINSLLKFDVLLYGKNKYLSENSIKAYNVAELVSLKEQIPKELEDQKTYTKKIIYGLLTLAFLLLVSTLFFIRRNIRNKRKFNAIIEAGKNENNNTKKSNGSVANVASSSGLPKELVDELLLKLKAFEAKNKFVHHYTLASLAKELKTNSSYLSKIINSYKNCNFSTYLNDLRINYVIDQLTHDKKYRFYTIEAIANSIGFNTAQSFSSAFHKKTGLYPSYFIKRLEKQKKS